MYRKLIRLLVFFSRDTETWYDRCYCILWQYSEKPNRNVCQSLPQSTRGSVFTLRHYRTWRHKRDGLSIPNAPEHLHTRWSPSCWWWWAVDKKLPNVDDVYSKKLPKYRLHFIIISVWTLMKWSVFTRGELESMVLKQATKRYFFRSVDTFSTCRLGSG